MEATCLECGAESAEATGACARCGAPIGLQQPVEADPVVGLPSTWVAQAGPRYPRRRALVTASVGFGVLVALIAVVGARISSERSGNQLTWDQLRPGDCLAGSNMGLDNSQQWPDHVTRVACTAPHEAEMVFAGNGWPQSQGYPGDNAVTDQADNRCETEFNAYDGIDGGQSAFTVVSIVPGSSDWASGDRSLECVAYEPSTSGPSGGTPVSYSIKGSKK